MQRLLSKIRSRLKSSGISLRPDLDGVIIALILFAVSIGVEHTEPGRWVEFQAYRLLHWSLPHSDGERRLPLVIVDISHLPGGEYGQTSREDLFALVKAIAAEKPAAIGVDIDFSPIQGKSSLADMKFIEACWKIAQGPRKGGSGASAIPIFLGVGRTWKEAPERWLNGAKYSDMAVCVQVPPEDTRRLPRWFSNPIYGKGRYFRTMGEALAEAYDRVEGTPLPTIKGGLKAVVNFMPLNPSAPDEEQVSGEEEEEDKVMVGLALVNYSESDLLQEPEYTLKEMNAEDIPSASTKTPFAGKVVLIGDVKVSDTFSLYSPIRPVRGVYLQACAMYTFAGKPLSELHWLVRTGLDFMLTYLGLIFVKHFEAKKHSDHAVGGGAPTEQLDHIVRTFVQSGTLGIVLLVGLVLVRWFNILWLDFIVVLIASVLHGVLEALWLRAKTTLGASGHPTTSSH